MFMQDLTAFAPELSFQVPAPITTARTALSGLLSGTLVETATGWQAVETLAPGARIQTLTAALRGCCGWPGAPSAPRTNWC